ncbi:hypothetical protein WN944_019249 [Citrus x changshan-huyou]|uniref:Uncharacterized protein n=1 Tax=Citrus x changshan-huyou TaxID=2935761 RepID=A0AAP0QEY6_9ROSI
MAYGAWLKVAPLIDRMRSQRNKETENREQRRSQQEVVESENTGTHNPKHPNPTGENGAGLTQNQEEEGGLQMGLKHVAEEHGETLMIQGQEPKWRQADNKRQAGAAEENEDLKNSSPEAGNQKGKEIMEGKELKRLSEMNPTINQPNTTEEAQMSSDEVVVNKESYIQKSLRLNGGDGRIKPERRIR